jgi:hypothetical protein
LSLDWQQQPTLLKQLSTTAGGVAQAAGGAQWGEVGQQVELTAIGEGKRAQGSVSQLGQPADAEG